MSENNRRVRAYRLAPKGRARLAAEHSQVEAHVQRDRGR
jgi:hypothetical protein